MSGSAPGRICAGRVVLGGLVAAFVLLGARKLIATFLVGDEMIMLYNEYPPTSGELAAALVSGLAQGLVMAWLYAAVRPRLGPGPRTAILVGAAVWVLSSPHYLLVLGHVRMAGHMDHFPWEKYLVYVAPASLVASVLATIAGAAIYRERDPTSSPGASP